MSLSARLLLSVLLSCVCFITMALGDENSLRFDVPGHEREMTALNELFELHRSSKTRCTLWDAWLPNASVWPAVGGGSSPSADAMRAYYEKSLSGRFIDAEGYVSMNQHRGLAHPAGWPFPTWPQAGGVGWHFTHAGDGYARQLRVPLAGLDEFSFDGLKNPRIDQRVGLIVEPIGPRSQATTPAFRVDAYVTPFVTIEWSRDAVEGEAWLEWTSEEFPEFDPKRRIAVGKENARPGQRLMFSAVPTHRHPEWRGVITRLRLVWDNSGNRTPITIRSIHTAIDTRHPITNALFCRGVCDVFDWTGDVAFLRENIERVRTAIEFAIREFAVEVHDCVLVPWVGHDGRTGFRRDANGKKVLIRGRGVGNNYWDLLPCGQKDFLATLYLFDALRRVARLEREIASHEEWGIRMAPGSGSAERLSEIASLLRDRGRDIFWNAGSQRYVLSVDADGAIHDYGYTFANLEAIAYGFASDQQAAAIMEWINGERVVADDTAQGNDIYHWRFAPRASTKRNVEWYAWVWHSPESIPWGGQVQDGGAVLGFSYHDLHARLRLSGADDSWERLQAILYWFEEVQAEGGYRSYYAKAGRGTLQGAGTPGGLGVDKEFMESILVPQFMLDGFLGAEPAFDALLLNPKLPSDWPSLTVHGIHYHDHVIDVRATRDAVQVRRRRAGQSPLVVRLPDGDRRTVEINSEW